MRNILFLFVALFMLNISYTQVVTVGTGSRTNTSLPINPYYKYTYSQSIYLASEINQSGNIYRIKYKGKPGIQLNGSNEWAVYVGHTTESSFNTNGWIQVSNMTEVFNGTIAVVNDNVEITFTAPFNYNGTDNLVIAVDENKGEYDESSDMFFASDVADNRSLVFRHDNINPDPVSPPEGTTKKAIPNIDIDFNATVCNSPTALSVANITTTSAELSWTAGGTENSWDIEYGISGFSNGAGTMATSNANSYSLTGLSSGTAYEFYVRSKCAGGNLSGWVGPYLFRTECVPLSIPFFEGFESGYQQDKNILGCISQESITGIGAWKANNTYTDYNRTPRTGNWNAYLVSGNEDWLFIQVQLTAGKSYIAELYARQNDTKEASITISYGNEGNATAMTNVVAEETNIVDGDYQKVFGVISPATTGIYYIGIKGKLSNKPYFLSIDDIKISEAPACIEPSQLTVANITDSSADLSWTPIGNETSWIVEYGITGFTQGNGTTINATSNNYNLTGLLANTAYEFYVRSNCGTTDGLSEWSEPLNFVTSCAPFTSPHFEGFEIGYSHDTDILGCISQENISGTSGWKANNTYTDYNRTPRTGNWNAFLKYYNEDWFFIPVQLTGNKSYTVELYARQDQKTGAKISISYGTESNSASMVNSIVQETNIVDGDYQKVSGNFVPATTGFYYIGIKGKLSNTPYYLSVDDIRIIETPKCIVPKELTATNITDTSAELNWTAGGTEENWILEYGQAGFTHGSGTTVNLTTNTYSITELTTNTEYEFYVKADCGTNDGQSEWSSPVSFKTFCTAYSIPYFEGFESGYSQSVAIEGCVTQESVSGSSAWKANTSLIDYNRTPRTGNWNAYLAYGNNSWFFVPMQLTAGKTYELELYARQDAGSGAFITISYGSTNTSTGMTNVIVGETNIVDGDYQKLSGTITPETTGTYFVGINGKLNYTPYYLSIDDLKITESATTSCTAPTNLETVNITKSTAELTWEASGTETAWIVEYGEAGFTQGNGTIVNTTNNPYKLTELTENANYDFYVKADCGSVDNQSDWAGPHSFTVACSSFTPTYFEGFETGYVHDADVANCISQESVSGGLGWRANNTHTNYNRAPRTGNWNIYLPYNNEDWFFIPFQLTGGKSYTIDLYARQDSNSGASIAVSYGSVNTAAGMTNIIVAETDIVNGGYQKIIGNITPETTGIYYIGIKGKLNYTPYYLSVDDIRLRETPTCIEPSSLSVSNVTDNSAELSWTAGGSETAWVIEYGETGFTQGNGTTVNLDSNQYILTDISSNTNYDFYVKSDCGGNNGYSEWSGPYTFKTLCVPYTVPYFEGFETGYIHNTNIVGCITQEGNDSYNGWKANNVFTDYNRTPRTGEWNVFLKFSNEEWMYIPVQLTAGKSYTVELYARQDESSGAQITVSYGTSSVVTAMTNTIVQETEIINGDYQKISGSFTPTESRTYFVGIKGKLNYTPYYLSVDDISIKETASCVTPTDLTATSVTSTSAELSWTAGGSETAWVVEYGEEGFTQGSGTTVNVTANPYSLTGLTANTSYEFYVKADCGTTDGQSEWSESLVFSTTLSTTDVNLDKQLMYYPNPVKDYLHINAENTVKKVSIFNTSGQLVLNKNTDAKAVEINVANLKPGIYVVKTTLDNNNVEVFKLIKK